MGVGGWRKESGDKWGDLDIAIVRVCARFGYTYTEAGRLLKRTRNSVAGVARRCDILFPRSKKKMTR